MTHNRKCSCRDTKPRSSQQLQGFSMVTSVAFGNPWMDGDSAGMKTLYDRWRIPQRSQVWTTME